MASISSSSAASSSNSPCAACKFLRRKCMAGCIFALYFPGEEPQKFAIVHKIFGASNVSKLLNELLPQQREDAVNSLAYEAEARIKDPVYGCVGAISVLQRQVQRLQKELEAANADLLRYACSDDVIPPLASPTTARIDQYGIRRSRLIGNEASAFYPAPLTTAVVMPAIPYSQWAAAANNSCINAAGESNASAGGDVNQLGEGGESSSM